MPDDPVALGRGLVAGTFGTEDLDSRYPDHVGWLARAFLGTLGAEHQGWRRAREQNPRVYPDAVLLPASDEAVLSAPDAVMSDLRKAER